jgi:hypothetical protein
MGQLRSKLIAKKQSSLHILTFPEELFTFIAPFLDSESQLALAHTCTKIYGYHKKKCREIVVLLHGLQNSLLFRSEHRKVLARWLGETGWAAMKVIPTEVSIDSQNNNSHLLRTLCLNSSFQLPNGLNCKSIDILILEHSLYSLLTISFWEKFPNLKIVSLTNIIFNENIISALSMLSLLEIISLNLCIMSDDCLSKIFKTCTTLKEIELYSAKHATPIIFPPQVTRLCIANYDASMEIDLSRCIQLRSL